MGTSYDNIAVFYRTNAQSRILKKCSICLRLQCCHRIIESGTHSLIARNQRCHGVPQVVVNPDDDMAARVLLTRLAAAIGATSIERSNIRAV